MEVFDLLVPVCAPPRLVRKWADGRARRFVYKGVNERKGHDNGVSCVHFYAFPCLWVCVCTRSFVVFDESVKWCKSRGCGALTRIFFICLTAVVFHSCFHCHSTCFACRWSVGVLPNTYWNAHDQLLLKNATTHATVAVSGQVANFPAFFCFRSTVDRLWQKHKPKLA